MQRGPVGRIEAWLLGDALCHTSVMARLGAFGLGYGLRSRAASLALCVVVGLPGFGAVVVVAQDNKVPTLHAYTNLVQVPVLVLDGGRKPMAPITEGRFFVSVDGGPKFRVTHARLEGEDPISLAILLDVSQPFPVLMRRIDDAIAGLAPLSLHTKDHVSIYSLDCHLVRSGGDVSADSATLKRAVDMALESWRAHGRDRHKRDCQTPWNLWDSLTVATQALSELPGRRVILAVTDGVDQGSKTSWNALRALAQGSGVAIFGLVQPGDMSLLFRTGVSNHENLFNSLCELTGGLVLTSTEKDVAAQLTWFMTLVRGRYIVEFPHPVDTAGGEHGMDITMGKSDAFIRPAGISVPVDDPAVLNDPTTVPSDPSHVPQMGKRKALAPH
jgi:hypothetical protein